MKIVDESRFEILCEHGEIVHEGCAFVDGLKVVLHLGEKLLKSPRLLHPQEPWRDKWQDIRLPAKRLKAGRLYLAKTLERLSLSSRLFGILSTRSEWARLGLDVLRSSCYVSPGFGAGNPIPLVLELSPVIELRGINPRTPVAGLLLFELEKPVRVGRNDHINRFPLKRDRS